MATTPRPPRTAKTDRKEASRERILEVASRGLRRSGFHGIGVADVMKQAGLTHGGFYAHFESRDELLGAAATRAGQDSRARFDELVQRLTAAGVPPFRAMVETYLHESGITDCENGCPVAALVSEMPRQSGPVQAVSRALMTHLHRMAVAALGERTTEDDAWAIVSCLVGALQLARAFGDSAQGRAVLDSTRHALLTRYGDDGNVMNARHEDTKTSAPRRR